MNLCGAEHNATWIWVTLWIWFSGWPQHFLKSTLAFNSPNCVALLLVLPLFLTELRLLCCVRPILVHATVITLESVPTYLTGKRVVTRLLAKYKKIFGSSPERSKVICLHIKDSGAHKTLYSVGTCWYLLVPALMSSEVRWPSGAQDKNEWNSTSILPYALMACTGSYLYPTFLS